VTGFLLLSVSKSLPGYYITNHFFLQVTFLVKYAVGLHSLEAFNNRYEMSNLFVLAFNHPILHSTLHVRCFRDRMQINCSKDSMCKCEYFFNVKQNKTG
jgi:hypothetical protein